VKIALCPFGADEWMGGWNYMLNLAETLSAFAGDAVSVALFVAPEVSAESTARIDGLARVEVVRDPAFDRERRSARLRQALATGIDRAALDVFQLHGVTVVLESAWFFGWRFPLPCFAWFPDFQHRHLPHLFSRGARVRREIGFCAQVLSGRPVMLSSHHAERDCHHFYPSTRGRTFVAPFAVPAPPVSVTDVAAARQRYALPPRFVLIANQLWPHKNHAVAIAAAKLLGARGSDVVIAASGEVSATRDGAIGIELNRQVAALGPNARFRFLGRIPFSDVMALTKGAAALVNPSRFEGWNTAVEEARAMGTPMVLSDLAVHREQAGGIADFFDPDDPVALADLLESLNIPATGRDGDTADSRARRAAFAASVVGVARQASGTAA
jgi:glycosyltransferase involved in cell wall biosynthesis